MEAVIIRGITKTYRVGVGRARVREMTPWPFDRMASGMFPRWWSKDTFDALHDVSFSIHGGSCVGIIGHNGAGKTTLLRVIAGVTAPTRGGVSVSGRVAALIDVVVGFHPDLTGRENVYLLGAMHGFRRRAMLQRMDAILEFSEIGEFADTPLKRYSAGMSARLGFATLTALDVDILLIDEVLAVGDASFQRKCVGWLEEYRVKGGTLLFVSHNLGLVRNMTERAIWLERGRLVDDAPTSTIVPRYARAAEHRDEGISRWAGKTVQAMAARGLHRWGSGGARVQEVRLEQTPSGGTEVELAITYEAPLVDRAVFCVGFVDETGRDLGAAASPVLPLRGGGGALRCVIRSLPLRTGVYFPVVAILSPEGGVLDRWTLDRAVVVERDGTAELADALGPVEMKGQWSEGNQE
jgi:ABC-type polysaccharide/polyol phosphate transport system ATPase subunit